MGWILLVLLIVVATVALPVALVGLSIWGVFKGVRALHGHITNKLPGHAESQPPRTPDGHEPRESGGPSRPRSHATYHASDQHASQSAKASRASRDFEYMDVDRGTTPERISRVMQAYVDDYVVGEYASAVIDALASADFRRRSLLPEIENRFEPGSLSWERFVGPTEAALDAVLNNCALLANRVQSFDSVDYAKMESFYRSGGFDANGKTDPARLQRWKLLYDTKREMDELRSANDALLLELGKLAMELGRLSSNTSHGDSAAIAEELNNLVNDTKFYQ